MLDLLQRWTAAMRAGDYELAWALAEETRLTRDPATRNDPTKPYHQRWVWDGSRIGGRRVLVRCYRGLGDTIQFARYLPALCARAAAVTVETPGRLVSLLQTIASGAEVLPFDPDRPVPPADCDVEITELDAVLRLPPERASPPYIHARKAPLPSGAVGICYRAGEWDRDRSVPPELLANLCASRPCLTLVSEPTALPVLNPCGCPFDIAVTASLVASVDLVITVDTMIVHLAGAMNKPTWLLLKSEPDWRWDPAVSRSPWYPSLRLFVQHRAGDWSRVVRALEQELVKGEANHAQPAGPVRTRLLG
jgi:hypothetical protein